VPRLRHRAERRLGDDEPAAGDELERDLTPVAAELYQRLSLVLYDAADYRQAEEALDTALGLCRTGEDADTEVACVTCLVYVLRERGEWARAARLFAQSARRTGHMRSALIMHLGWTAMALAHLGAERRVESLHAGRDAEARAVSALEEAAIVVRSRSELSRLA